MLSLKEVAKRIDRVNVRLDAVKTLFKLGEDEIEETIDGLLVNKHIDLKHIFSNQNVSITLVSYTSGQKHFPTHAHNDSIEYLIIVNGKLFVKFQDGSSRVVMRGECVAIPRGVFHTGHSLEEGTQLIAVCVPPEIAYIPKENDE